MKYPWNIYPNLWQNSDFITTQSLNNIDNHNQSNWSFLFKNSPLKEYYGVHGLSLNFNQLSLGNIVIDEISCTFPNGQNFSYNSQWKKFNGYHYLTDNNDNIYSIECNLKNYTSLFQNRTFLELGLIIDQNSFQQDNFFTIVSEVEDLIENNDVNIVTVRVPIVKLVPIDIIKNYNNYLPIVRVKITNEIFTLIEYQYPVIYIKILDTLGKKLDIFINDLYKKLIYIYRENKNLDEIMKRLLSIIMNYVFVIQSLLKNSILTVNDWYEKSINLLGQLESFMDYNWKVYYFHKNDILKTFNEINDRINYIFDNFYNIGLMGVVQKNQDKYIFNINIDKNTKIYLDFSANVEKNHLMNWIENSIIDEESQWDNNLSKKNRGFNRWLIDSKINNNDNSVWLRYEIEILIFNEPLNIFLFNPLNIDNLSISWINKKIQ